MKKPIQDLTIYDFLGAIKPEIINTVLGPKESRQFWYYMRGQTMSEDGVYPADLLRFLRLRKQGLTASKMPIED